MPVHKSDISVITACFKLINFYFQILSFFLKVPLVSHLTFFQLLPLLGLDSATTTLQHASFDLTVLSTLHETMVYAVSALLISSSRFSKVANI
jgi:hypothetical protein